MSLFGKGHRNVCAGLDWNSWISLMLCSRCLGSPTRYVDSDIWLISLHMETCCQMTGRKSRNAISKWVGVVWNRHSFHGVSFPTVSYRMMFALSLTLTIAHYNKNKCHRMVDGWSWLVTYYYGNPLLQDILASSSMCINTFGIFRPQDDLTFQYVSRIQPWLFLGSPYVWAYLPNESHVLVDEMGLFINNRSSKIGFWVFHPGPI